jgi:hypothetical protein
MYRLIINMKAVLSTVLLRLTNDHNRIQQQDYDKIQAWSRLPGFYLHLSPGIMQTVHRKCCGNKTARIFLLICFSWLLPLQNGQVGIKNTGIHIGFPLSN